MPIYNIPELQSIASQLILSRSTIDGIFTGAIQRWNDPAILNDNGNNNAVRLAIGAIQSPINVVVRTDSSGTTQIFSTALSSFSAAFASTVQASSTPTWCGKLTDEVQIFTISGCRLAPMVATKIGIYFLTKQKVLTSIYFPCNASAIDLQNAFLGQTGTAVTVTKMYLNIANSTWSYRVGYSDVGLITKNWYQPSPLNLQDSRLQISTLQEGAMRTRSTPRFQ